jgi:hypothetical protein
MRIKFESKSKGGLSLGRPWHMWEEDININLKKQILKMLTTFIWARMASSGRLL